MSSISDALCHARFYGDNSSSDEVPLMKILQVTCNISSFLQEIPHIAPILIPDCVAIHVSVLNLIPISVSCAVSKVFRTLLLSECGQLLSDDNVWEIFKACFNICFEMRLSGGCGPRKMWVWSKNSMGVVQKLCGCGPRIICVCPQTITHTL